MAQRLKIPGDLHTRAAFEPSTFDEKAGTVEVVFTTGVRCLRRSWEGPYYEELEVSESACNLSRLNNGAPYLDDHPEKYGITGVRTVLGVVERAWLAGPAGKKEGRALLRFSSRDEVKPIKQDVKDGILRHLSIGYSMEQIEKVEEIEGVPVYRATRWTPYEISQTPIAFDDAAVVRSRTEQEFTEVEVISTAASTAAEEMRSMEPKPVTTATPPAAAPAAPPAAAPAPLAPAAAPDAASVRSALDAAQSANARAAQVSGDAVRLAAERAASEERDRMVEIRSLVRSIPNMDGAAGDRLSDEYIRSKATVNDVRKAVLDKLLNNEEPDIRSHLSITAGDDEAEKFVRGASAWFFLHTGQRSLLELAKAKRPDEFKDIVFDAGEFRGLSPRELAREALRRRGVETRAMDPMKMIGLAFTYRANYQTISDFATMLENALGKVLLGAYATQNNTWPRICKVEEVPDFRASARYRTGSLPTLDVVPEHAEFKTGVIPDAAKYAVQTATYGKMFGVSRQMIINDDMGALANLAVEMGKAADRTIENAVYALLTAGSGLGANLADGNPFFYAARGNINSSGSALSVAGIDADRVVMRSQKDPAGNDYLDLNPAILLVPETLKGTAQEINDAQYDFDNAGTNTTGKFMRPNKVRGLFREVVSSPRLSGTRRYVIADTLEAIIVAFLQGQGRGPRLDTENGWRVEGVEYKVALDAKAQFGDPKAAVTNAGA
jgi:hypothetical protein